METCKYDNELIGFDQDEYQAIAAMYPGGVIAWSTNMPPELVMHLAGIVADKYGLDYQHISGRY
jgi:hypothetical protein